MIPEAELSWEDNEDIDMENRIKIAENVASSFSDMDKEEKYGQIDAFNAQLNDELDARMETHFYEELPKLEAEELSDRIEQQTRLIKAHMWSAMEDYKHVRTRSPVLNQLEDDTDNIIRKLTEKIAYLTPNHLDGQFDEQKSLIEQIYKCDILPLVRQVQENRRCEAAGHHASGSSRAQLRLVFDHLEQLIRDQLQPAFERLYQLSTEGQRGEILRMKERDVGVVFTRSLHDEMVEALSSGLDPDKEKELVLELHMEQIQIMKNFIFPEIVNWRK